MNKLILIALLFVSGSFAYYCGNNKYDQTTGQCICASANCCAPKLYPISCCDYTPATNKFNGSWILVDTTDPNNALNTEVPLNISFVNNAYTVNISWINTPNGPKNTTGVFVPTISCSTSYLTFSNSPISYYDSINITYGANTVVSGTNDTILVRYNYYPGPTPYNATYVKLNSTNSTNTTNTWNSGYNFLEIDN